MYCCFSFFNSPYSLQPFLLYGITVKVTLSCDALIRTVHYGDFLVHSISARPGRPGWVGMRSTYLYTYYYSVDGKSIFTDVVISECLHYHFCCRCRPIISDVLRCSWPPPNQGYHARARSVRVDEKFGQTWADFFWPRLCRGTKSAINCPGHTVSGRATKIMWCRFSFDSIMLSLVAAEKRLRLLLLGS